MDFKGEKILDINNSDIHIEKTKVSKVLPFTQGTLIEEMKKRKIGRPSTYAPTITILQNRRYIENENSQLKPTKIAFTVIEILEKYFSDIVDETFTANMEKTLDVIAEKGGDWQKVLLDFYYPFMEKIEKKPCNKHMK